MQISQCQIPEVKSDSVQTRWTGLMKECLIKTEIFGKSKSDSDKYLCLDTNSFTDLPHKMVKKSEKIFQIPQLKIHCEALNLLRANNEERMLKQKEKKLVEKEIVRLKQKLEKKRLTVQKRLKETTSVGLKSLRNSTQYPMCYPNQLRKPEFHENICHMNTWFNGFVLVEAEFGQEGIPFDVSVALKSQGPTEEFLEPAPTLVENVTGDDYSKVSEAEGKNEIMEKFFHRNIKAENENLQHNLKKCEDVNKMSNIENKMNLRKMEYAWMTWKFYTEERKKRKREKTIYKNKIDAFLKKLQKEENIEKRINTSNYQGLRIQDDAAKISEKQKKEEKLKKLMGEVKESQAEVTQRLKEIKKVSLKKDEELRNLSILKKMEERREERLIRRSEIQERKKKLEEEKKKVEKLKEEENRRKKLEESKEKLKLEKERKKEKRLEREKLRVNVNLAENHYRKYLLRSFGLRPWLALTKMQSFQQQQALSFYEGKLFRNTFNEMKANVRKQANLKIRRAEEFHERMLKKNFLQIWLEFHMEKIKEGQVAADWNDFRITNRAFNKWLEFTEKEQLDYLNKNDVAVLNYEGKLKMRYFKKLLDYPEIKKMEQAKENTKRKWREKVKEILPDYQPTEISDMEKLTRIFVQ